MRHVFQELQGGGHGTASTFEAEFRFRLGFICGSGFWSFWRVSAVLIQVYCCTVRGGLKRVSPVVTHARTISPTNPALSPMTHEITTETYHNRHATSCAAGSSRLPMNQASPCSASSVNLHRSVPDERSNTPGNACHPPPPCLTQFFHKMRGRQCFCWTCAKHASFRTPHT